MPNPAHLNSLSVTGLRGVLQTLNLEFNKPMTLVYGENGTGKTSICDALDLLGNGECGSLADISVGAGKHHYWPFIGQRAANVNVELVDASGANWSASLNGRRVSVTSSNRSTAPIVKVWRRKQLMNLILSTPADRYRVIEPFIDVSQIDRSEEALKSLQDSTRQKTTSASIRAAESRATLEDQQRLYNDNSEDIVLWARNEVGAPVENLDAELEILDDISHKITLLIDTLGQHTNSVASVDQQIATVVSAKAVLDNIRERTDENSNDILGILESAQSFFHEHNDADACPLCESEENIAGLPERIDQKLTAMTELRQAKFTHQQAQKTLQQAEASCSASVERIEELTQELLEDIVNEGLSETSQNLLSDLTEESAKDTSVLTNTKADIDGYKTSLSEQKGRRDSLKAALDQYDENKQSLRENARLMPKINRLLQIHEEKRKQFVDNVLSSIAGEVGRLYEVIHPGEGLNHIALQLDPGRRASLDIQSEFLGQHVQPGAYFSNSHLDSLGMCILIALAKLNEPEKTILVLDDILGSIDEPHVDRVVQMLYEESQHFMHTLITTHYHAWHHKIRRGQLRNADCQVIELSEWQPASGVTIRGTTRSLVDILRANINNNPGEIEPIAANAGHLLEQLGDFLVSHYECSVPKKIRGNTLNEYLDGLKPGFIRHLRVEILQSDDTYVELKLEPVITELKDIYQVRNTTGAHYNEMASHLPPADVLRFGELVVQLADALICADNGFPTREKNGAYWATAGETRRLHPLKRP